LPYVMVPVPSEHGEAWLCVPISFEKLEKFEKNEIEIRHALTQPESALLRIEMAETCCSIFMVEPSSLSEEMLPKKGEYLDYV